MKHLPIILIILGVACNEVRGQDKPRYDTSRILLQWIDTAKHADYYQMDTVFWRPVTQVFWTYGYEVRERGYWKDDRWINGKDPYYLNADKRPFNKSVIAKPF